MFSLTHFHCEEIKTKMKMNLATNYSTSNFQKKKKRDKFTMTFTQGDRHNTKTFT